MKQAEIRRYRPGERTNPYLAAVPCCRVCGYWALGTRSGCADRDRVPRYIVGDRAWLNVMLDRWNTVHEGGLALFSGTASERDIWAFALLAAK